METKQDYQSRAQFILKKAFSHEPQLTEKIGSFYWDLTHKQQPEQQKSSSKHETSLDIDEVFHMGSLSNEVYRVNLKNGNTIIVKHYFDILKDFVQRDIEHKILNIMTQRKQYPFVFYKDNFCRVEAYIPGSSISRQQLNPKLLRKITQSLANFTLKYEGISSNAETMKLREIGKAFELYRDIYKTKRQQNPVLVDKVAQYVDGVLKKEIFDNLSKILLNHRMIMNHNDSNLSNILVLNHVEAQTPEIQLLDFEFANLNYMGYDIGNLLNEIATDYGGAYGVDQLGKQHKFEIRKDWEVDEGTVKEIINLYFDMVEGNDKKSTWEERCRMVKVGRLLSHVFWLFVGLKQIDDPNIDLNMTYYVRRRYEEFMNLYKTMI